MTWLAMLQFSYFYCNCRLHHEYFYQKAQNSAFTWNLAGPGSRENQGLVMCLDSRDNAVAASLLDAYLLFC